MYSSDPLAALNYSFSLNMPGSDADLFNLVSHFPVHTEQYYLFFLSIGVFFAIPAHILIIFVAAFRTPKEMINYRLTVTNTSVWSLLVVIHSGLLIRPVPLFPLSIAKTTGIVKVLGDVWGGQIQYIILMMIITNFLTASIICFMVICLFLLQNSLRTMFSRRIGIMMAIFTHLSMTLFVLLFLTFVYTPTNNLKSQLILDYGANRLKGLIDEDTVIFGYYNSNLEKHSELAFYQLWKLEFLSILIFTMFAVVVVIVLILYGMLIKQIWHAINKASKKETNRSRRAIVFMLTSRTIVPLTFGFIPVMIVSLCLHYSIWLPFGVYCALICTAISHGLFNCLATIAVFAPYRRGLLRALYTLLPISMSNRIGLTDYIEETSWQGIQTKTKKSTSRVHTTNTSVYIVPDDPAENRKKQFLTEENTANCSNHTVK